MTHTSYTGILEKVGTRIKEDEEKKKKGDFKHANNFNFLNFFGPGENKISEILAFFLNPDASHGQGDRFLKEFLRVFDVAGTGNFKNIRCERPTDEGRRLDIWIEFSDFTVAIENKIWAYDQEEQLADYADYLSRISKNNFLLLYLNPYGIHPSEKSIGKIELEDLQNQGKIRIISYKSQIFDLLDLWKGVCEAQIVIHFIDQFKHYLKLKIIGKNTVMTKGIKKIVHQYSAEAEVLVNTYIGIKNSLIFKVNEVSRILRAKGIVDQSPVSSNFVGPFNHDKYRVFKIGVDYKGNRLYVQLMQDEISIGTNYYEDDGFDQDLLDFLKSNNIESIKEDLSSEMNKELLAEDLRNKAIFVQEKIIEYVNNGVLTTKGERNKIVNLS